MKKLALVLAIVLAVASLAFCVSAEYISVEDNKITVTYDNATAGSYYAIIAVKGIVVEGTAPSITEETIQYIDQVTATGTTVSFANFLLKVDYEEATLYLGGSDLDAPILLGYVNKSEDGEKIDVNFVVNSDAAASGIAITLIPASGDPISLITSEGKVAADDGVYSIKVTKKGHLSYTKTDVKLSELTAPINVELLGGDVNADDVINFDDFSALLSVYNTDDADCDITGDNLVAFDDFSELLKNYGATAIVD